MLDPVEILDLQHCRRVDPDWAAKKARHCLEDAAACDVRVAQGIHSYAPMAERYRARARILTGEA
jgi:hypothetical protein